MFGFFTSRLGPPEGGDAMPIYECMRIYESKTGAGPVFFVPAFGDNLTLPSPQLRRGVGYDSSPYSRRGYGEVGVVYTFFNLAPPVESSIA